MNWFLRVQDKEGGWKYDPQDPKRNQGQGASTPGMTAAGLGSVYVGSHLLGFTVATEKIRKAESAIPSALQDVNEKKKAKIILPLRPTGTNEGAVKAAQSLGDAWFAKKGWQFADERWKYYYIYALEQIGRAHV